MNYNGEHLIKTVQQRLKDEGYVPYEGGAYTNALLNKIRSLDSGELNQIVSFGDVQKWHNDRINHEGTNSV